MAADAQLRFEVELDLKQIEKSVQQAAELVRDGLTQALSGIESSFVLWRLDFKHWGNNLLNQQKCCGMS